jgi:hypothetical protein
MLLEGGCDQRLDIVVDPELPAGRTGCGLDQADMKEAKKTLGLLRRQGPGRADQGWENAAG